MHKPNTTAEGSFQFEHDEGNPAHVELQRLAFTPTRGMNRHQRRSAYAKQRRKQKREARVVAQLRLAVREGRVRLFGSITTPGDTNGTD